MGRDSLRPVEAPLYPRIKANAAQQDRNACGAKERTAWSLREVLVASKHPPLSSVSFCGYSCRSDKDPGCTLTCTMPPAPSLENSSSCCSHVRSQPAPILLSALCLSLAALPTQPHRAVLSSRESEARRQDRARKDIQRAAVGPDLSALSYKQGLSHCSVQSPIASALEPAAHHGHHLAASGKIPEQGIEIHIPRKQLWPWIPSRPMLRSSGSCLT